MNSKDTLKTKIEKAKTLLSKESIEAIDSINWKSIIQEMKTKYNPDQLENLEIETELLLCGILNPKEYENEVGKRMKIQKNEVSKLLNEMNNLIFKKIQEKLTKILSKKEEEKIQEEKEIDPRFNSLPNNLQQAIKKSNYQEKIYELGQKYKFSIEELGILEEIINKTILGTIQTDKLKEELKSKIKLEAEKLNEFFDEINNSIFKKIRDLLKEEGMVPLPPYKKVESSKEQVVRNEEKNDDSELLKHGVEIINDEKQDISPEIKEVIRNNYREPVNEIGMDFISQKLSKPIVSESVVKDYSLPKVNSSKKDPYHEEI